MTNVLIAIKNIIDNPLNDVVSYYSGSNRINGVGDALEKYIKDIFANTLEVQDENEKQVVYSKLFSYIGNQNNPPDLMIRGGDAIEVKKIQSLRSSIALNSSYPKDKLYSDSPMITRACKECEDWSEKDIYYTVGVTDNRKIKTLWFIQGCCYSAEKETYEKIKNKIKDTFVNSPNVEFAETKELGRINRVDPLGITNFRIRGMWHIENPIKVYDYITKIDETSDFSVNLILLKEKYLSYPENDRAELEKIKKDNFKISYIKIKSPNNPAKLLDAILVNFNI